MRLRGNCLPLNWMVDYSCAKRYLQERTSLSEEIMLTFLKVVDLWILDKIFQKVFDRIRGQFNLSCKLILLGFCVLGMFTALLMFAGNAVVVSAWGIAWAVLSSGVVFLYYLREYYKVKQKARKFYKSGVMNKERKFIFYGALRLFFFTYSTPYFLLFFAVVFFLFCGFYSQEQKVLFVLQGVPLFLFYLCLVVFHYFRACDSTPTMELKKTFTFLKIGILPASV